MISFHAAQDCRSIKYVRDFSNLMWAKNEKNPRCIHSECELVGYLLSYLELLIWNDVMYFPGWRRKFLDDIISAK